MRQSILLVMFVLFAGFSWAQTPSVGTLPEITVIDSPEITTPGTSVLDRQTLESLPQGDGAITDLLKVLPGIQFSEVDNSSLTGGEILPAEISISGGRVYDNNFMIDGISNNSLLDPTSNNPTSIITVPGHSQSLFLDTALIDSISVYRSNISARYNGFTGGVVDVETRDPKNSFGGQFSLRSTRSEWTSFHVERSEREDFLSSEEADRQPEFRKYAGQVSFDVPISETLSVLTAYSQTYSSIPLHNFGDEKKQYRKLENFFAKVLYQPTDLTSFRLTYLSSPYEGEYFRDNWKESDFTVEGGGWSLIANLEHQFSFVHVEWLIGWQESENNRVAPQDYFAYRSTPSVDWGGKYSKKGGYGDISKEQTQLTLAMHAKFDPFHTGWFKHQWISGISFEKTEGREKRIEDSTQYSVWLESLDVNCSSDSVDCIDGEQFCWFKTFYPKYDSNAEISSVDVYLEDSITLNWFTWRVGLNLMYNDLMKNMDYAFRNTVSFDPYMNGSTILSAGANRYYGKSLLSHALAEDRKPYLVYKRSKTLSAGIVDDWEESPRSSFPVTRLSELNTPYVDEWSVSFEQDFYGGRLSLCYIDRNGEDGLTVRDLAKDDEGYKVSEWTNLGNSRHQELTASWERRWENHYLLVDGTWQDSQISNEDYAENMELDDFDDRVWFNGHEVNLVDLPRSDYNREWSANLIYSATLPYGFTFTNITRYRCGYEAIGKTDQDKHVLPDGEKLAVYDNISYPSATTFDWKIEWEYAVTTTQSMTISADIYNVFNRKIYTGVEGEYQMGRQLWVGLDYRF